MQAPRIQLVMHSVVAPNFSFDRFQEVAAEPDPAEIGEIGPEEEEEFEDGAEEEEMVFFNIYSIILHVELWQMSKLEF